ncbi:MAG: GTPase ObgE [Nitrospirota bacterium]
MFVDQVKIYVKGGDGGNGCVSFRREKYVPKGGPNGGDGGDGSDIIIKASLQLSTLLDLRYQQHYIGKRGRHGQGKDKHGRDSHDIIIKVPVGTIIKDYETKEIISDLTEEEKEIVVAKGGRGGRGNTSFKTSTNQAPAYAEEGKKGEEKWLSLELKLIADIGLIGLPNAGKSTLISRISSARPRVAPYPFTTLAPKLGVVSWKRYKNYVVADIPGIIEGAHKGKGLGFQFLRHIERTSFLLYLIDISDYTTDDSVKTYNIINRELYKYNPVLSEKPHAVAVTKVDIKGSGERLKSIVDYCKKKGDDIFPISSVTGEGIEVLIKYLGEKIEK